MMTPNDFKNITFTQSFRGYTKAEVDALLEQVRENYTKLYEQYAQLRRSYDQLTEQYRTTEAALAVMKDNEDAIRRALVNSQNAAAKVVEAAERRGEEIEELTRKKCGEILSSFREHIRSERERLNALRAQVADFKNRIYEQYQSHIEMVEHITGTLSQEDWDMSSTDATRAVLLMLRGELERRTRNDEREEERLDHEIDIVLGDIAKEKKSADEAGTQDPDEEG